MKYLKIVVSVVLCVACVLCVSCTQSEPSNASTTAPVRPPETPSFDFDIDWDAFESGMKDALERIESEHTYLITYTKELTYNQSVGNEWDKGVRYNGEYISDSSQIIVDKSLTQIELVAFATELDLWNDYGATNVTFDVLDVGQEQTKWATVIVVENEGRYTGNRAEWYFEITIKRIA